MSPFFYFVCCCCFRAIPGISQMLTALPLCLARYILYLICQADIINLSPSHRRKRRPSDLLLPEGSQVAEPGVNLVLAGLQTPDPSTVLCASLNTWKLAHDFRPKTEELQKQQLFSLGCRVTLFQGRGDAGSHMFSSSSKHRGVLISPRVGVNTEDYSLRKSSP